MTTRQWIACSLKPLSINTHSISLDKEKHEVCGGRVWSVDKNNDLISDQCIILSWPKPLQIILNGYGCYLLGLRDKFCLQTYHQLVRSPCNHNEELYRERWYVEFFFKFVISHLHTKSFFGTSLNTVNTDCDTLVIMLLLIEKKYFILNVDL